MFGLLFLPELSFVLGIFFFVLLWCYIDFAAYIDILVFYTLCQSHPWQYGEGGWPKNFWLNIGESKIKTNHLKLVEIGQYNISLFLKCINKNKLRSLKRSRN